MHRLYDVDIFRDGRNRGGSGPAYFCVLLLSQQKEFGGITGDTAGYFVTFCEGCVVVAAAIAEHMMLTV